MNFIRTRKIFLQRGSHFFNTPSHGEKKYKKEEK